MENVLSILLKILLLSAAFIIIFCMILCIALCIASGRNRDWELEDWEQDRALRKSMEDHKAKK